MVARCRAVRVLRFPLGDDARLDAVGLGDSGAMALTGRADGPPLGPPAPMVPALRALADRLAAGTAAGGAGGAHRPAGAARGAGGPGRPHAKRDDELRGRGRLLRAEDGWIAASLARPDDWGAVPAWLDAEASWAAVAAAVAVRPVAAVLAQGVLLGLPVAALAARRPAAALRWTLAASTRPSRDGRWPTRWSST